MRHPRVEVEIVIEDRLVDIVAEGYDAGVRLSEIIDRDTVQVRLTPPCRFVVVGTPEYLARRGTPKRRG
jgi:DNA-binding transcriptional LysR family regulator